jgi:hypothetical protein
MHRSLNGARPHRSDKTAAGNMRPASGLDDEPTTGPHGEWHRLIRMSFFPDILPHFFREALLSLQCHRFVHPRTGPVLRGSHAGQKGQVQPTAVAGGFLYS